MFVWLVICLEQPVNPVMQIFGSDPSCADYLKNLIESLFSHTICLLKKIQVWCQLLVCFLCFPDLHVFSLILIGGICSLGLHFQTRHSRWLFSVGIEVHSLLSSFVFPFGGIFFISRLFFDWHHSAAQVKSLSLSLSLSLTHTHTHTHTHAYMHTNTHDMCATYTCMCTCVDKD